MTAFNHAQQESQENGSSPSRVLVADDGQSNCEFVRLVLQRAGMVVKTAVNGKEAVEAAVTQPFDAILMDMQMPVMDGYAAAAKLRELGYRGPIIALTAHATRADEQKCRDAGCSGFLTKPINADHLFSTLETLISETRTGATGSQRTEQVATAAGNSNTQCALEVSSASEDTDEYEAILLIFVKEFREQLAQMTQAVANEDFMHIAELAHSIKGAGGTFGFAEVSQTADKLEALAEQHQIEAVVAHVENLIDIANRIGVTEDNQQLNAGIAQSTGCETGSVSDNAITSTLPMDDEDFREIARAFIDRLSQKLGEIDEAWSARDFEKLASRAHWLKGTGGTAGFGVFTEPASNLEALANSLEPDKIEDTIADLHYLRQRLSVPQ